MALESTTREALLAELLGDVGRLTDSVNSLTRILPTQVLLVETKITGLIGLLKLAADLYEKQIQEHTNTNAATVRVQMEHDVLNAILKIEEKSGNAVQTMLKEVEITAKQIIKSEVINPTQKVLSNLQLSHWKTLALCIASGLLSGLVIVTIMHVIT